MDDSQSGHNGADIVLLAVAQSEVEGMMLAEAVRSTGINVLMKAGGPGMGAWASTATFEHRLYVRQDQLAKAREVLEGSSERGATGSRGRRRAPRVNPQSRHKPE